MTKLEKFTSLEQKKIGKIVSSLSPEVLFISKISKKLIEEKEEYKNLIEAFREAEDKKEFLNNNIQIIAEFLNECRLIGYKGEGKEVNEKKEKKKLNSSSFIIGAEGVSIISAYLAAKDKNSRGHPVEVIKNINLFTKGGSGRHSNISLEQKQIHDGFKNKLTEDLLNAGNGEFNKTYIIEVFGTTGGNHLVCVTIHKRKGEKDPVISLFDPSPAMLRGGIEDQQNSIAHGWCSQITINATLKKSLEDCGLRFNTDKYYSNSEPLQKSGSNLCATFVSEAAHEISRIDPEEHRKMLEETCKDDSLFGGKTEMPVNLEEIERDGYVMDPKLGLLRDEDVARSHFVNTAIKSRAEKLRGMFRVKKNGLIESYFGKILRNTDKDGNNQTVEQQALRNIGHLFEIVTSEAFLARADEDTKEPSVPEVEGNPYYPKASASEFPQQNDVGDEKRLEEVRNFIFAFNKFMMPRRANRSSFNKEQQEYTITIRLGEISGKKLIKFARENYLKTTLTTISFGENLSGVNPKLSQLQEISVIVPREKFGKLTKIMKDNKLCKPGNHPFMPPEKISPTNLVEPLVKKGGLERK